MNDVIPPCKIHNWCIKSGSEVLDSDPPIVAVVCVECGIESSGYAKEFGVLGYSLCKWTESGWKESNASR